MERRCVVRGLVFIAGAALGFSILAGCEAGTDGRSASFYSPARVEGVSGSNLSTDENRWAAVAVSGDSASWRGAGGIWQPLSLGEILEPDTQIMSGTSGVVMLERGADLMVVAENTQIELPATPGKKGLTEIIQSIGTLLLRVEKQPDRKFKVTTPYLVATVKGTEFDVGVTDEGASVSVSDGVVGVSRGDDGVDVDVVPGQTASVAANAPVSTPPAVEPTPSKSRSTKRSLPPKANSSTGKGANKAGGNNAKGGGGDNGRGDNNDNGNSGGNSNAGGNSGNSNAGGNSGNSNAGGQGKGKK